MTKERMVKRFLIAGWTIFAVGAILAFVIPRVILPTMILSIFLATVTVSYGIVSLFRQRMKRVPVPTIRPVEKGLVAGWSLFVVIILAAFFFANEKWVAACGPEIVLWASLIVVLSSLAYASYLLLLKVRKHGR
jgi:hypothetical protein